MRIISLVPSITETLFDFGLSENEIVGRTKFCIHPKNSVKKIEIIGGTKTLNLEKIKKLQPDLIIANKEENVKEQIEELMKFCDVWLTDINTLDDNRNFLKELGKTLNKTETAKKFIAETDKILEKPVQNPKKSAAYLIWKNPYMAVGSDTFINDVLTNLSFQNIFENEKRYPEISIDDLQPADAILLSTEPFPFKNQHIDEIQEIFPEKKVILVDGEAFSWYGTRISKKEEYFRELCAEIFA